MAQNTPTGQTYTPNAGLTPQGQAVTNAMPTVANSQAPVNPLTSDLSSFPSDQQLNQQAQQANANLLPFGTPAGRQQYITNSNLPAMQSNYEDLAKKLADYDTANLMPQFQGQNPGTPSDATSFGRVESSPLAMTEGSANLPSSQGLFNNDSRYAYTAQTAQGNNIADLLDKLNTGIRTSFATRIGTYQSDKQAAQDAVDTVFKVMGLKSNVAQKQAELQQQKEISNAQIANSRYEKMLELGYIDPTTGQVLDFNNREGANSGGSTGNVGIDDQRKALQDQYNTLPPQSPLRGKIANAWKAAHNTPLFPGALTDKQVDQLNTSADFLRLLDKIQSEITDLNSQGTTDIKDPVSQLLIERGGILGGLVTGTKGNLARDLILIQGMGDRKLMGGRLIRDLIVRFSGAFPNLYQDQSTILNRLNAMRNDTVSDLKTYASSQGYVDPQQFLIDHMVNDLNLNNSNTTKKVNGVSYAKGSDGLWHKSK